MMILKIISFIFQAYTMMLFARIISSWLPQLNDYRIMQFISSCTDPYLNFFRRFVPPLGMIDFSPIIAFLALNFAQNIVVNAVAGLIL